MDMDMQVWCHGGDFGWWSMYAKQRTCRDHERDNDSGVINRRK